MAARHNGYRCGQGTTPSGPIGAVSFRLLVELLMNFNARWAAVEVRCSLEVGKRELG